LNTEDYTTKYSRVIKIVQMLVLYQLYIEQENRYRRNQEIIDNIQARKYTEPMFDIVQRKVQKFIILVSDKGRPIPIDWIYKYRIYSIKIRYNTTAEGVIE
jgi:hypothetical protein